MKINHYINGALVNPPTNYEDTELEINFDPLSPDKSLTTTAFDWINEENDLLKAVLDGGVSGSQGIEIGVRHRIDIEENGTTLTAFDGFIDLTGASWGEDKVSASSSVLGGTDWLNEVADGFTFEYLYSKGYLTDSDKIFQPYVISRVPNYQDLFITYVTLAFLAMEFGRVASNLFPLPPPVAVPAPAKVGEAGSGIDTIGAILDMVIEILMLILLIITAIKLLIDLFNLLIQKVKYVAGMRVNTLLTAGCSYLGLNYDSDVLKSAPFDKLVILPKTFQPPATQFDEKIKGFLQGNPTDQSGYPDMSFGDLLRRLQEAFNLRIVPTSTKVQLLSKKQNPKSVSFKLQDYYNPNYRTNANEMISNYLVSFTIDTVDGNTIDKYQGTSVQSQLTLKSISDRRLSLMKNIRQRSIQFARAIRKRDLTEVEELVDTIFNVVGDIVTIAVGALNTITSVINSALKIVNKVTKAAKKVGIKIRFTVPSIPSISDPNLQNLIDNRVGMLLLEKDMIGVDKLTLIDIGSNSSKNKISLDNDTYLTAKYLFDTFHKYESFAPSRSNAQGYYYEFDQVEMNLADVINVLNEGFVYRSDGTLLEVVNCKWNASERLANFVLFERKIWSNNIQEQIYEPSGN